MRAELSLALARLQRELPRREMLRVLEILKRDLEADEVTALFDLVTVAPDDRGMVIELRRAPPDLIKRAANKRDG